MAGESIGQLTVKMIADASGVTAGVEKAKASVKTLGQSLKEVLSQGGGAGWGALVGSAIGTSLGGLVTTLTTKIGHVAKEALTKGFEMASEGVELVKADRLATKLSQAVVIATKAAAGIGSKEIFQLAEELESATGELIPNTMSAAAQLMRMKVVGGDAFKELIRLAKDYAAVRGMDIGSATELIGRAMLSGQRLNALGIGDERADVIREQFKTGDLAGGRKSIMDAIREQVGGAAEALVTPAREAAVAMERLKKAMGEPWIGVKTEWDKFKRDAIEGVTWIFAGISEAVKWYVLHLTPAAILKMINDAGDMGDPKAFRRAIAEREALTKGQKQSIAPWFGDPDEVRARNAASKRQAEEEETRRKKAFDDLRENMLEKAFLEHLQSKGMTAEDAKLTLAKDKAAGGGSMWAFGFGKSVDDLQKDWKAKSEARELNEWLGKSVESIEEMKAAMEDVDDLAKMMREAERRGVNDEDKERLRLMIEGTREKKKQVELDKQAKEETAAMLKDEQQRVEGDLKWARSLDEKVRTKEEQLQEQEARLQGLRNRGLITDEELTQRVKILRDEAKGETREGTWGTFNPWVLGRMGGNAQERTAKACEQIEKNTRNLKGFKEPRAS